MTGIDLTGHSNLVNGNAIQGNANSYGIFAAQGAIGNTITSNSITGDQYDVFDSNGPPCVNTWKRNTFQTSGGAVACIK
jgi:Periplasmic copper-binding protein (NosD)